jgi:hypothetical protein
MKNNSFLTKYKIFITPVILLLIFVMGVVLVLRLAIKKLDDNSIAIQKKMVELGIERDKIKELPKEQFTKVNVHEDELNVLFSEDNIVALVQAIERIAEETGNIISISVKEDSRVTKKVTAKKDVENQKASKLLDGFSEEEYFKIDIDVTGNYGGLIKFLDKFNSLDYYNSIVSFNITSREEEQKIIGRSINIDLNKDDEISEDYNKLILESEISAVFYLNKVANKLNEKDGS